MRSIMRKAASLLPILILALCILLLLNAQIQIQNGEPLPMFMGWGAATVVTGSMEPAIPVGSLIIIQQKDTYNVGDIVTYDPGNGATVTHRIVAIQNDLVMTQGDANNAEDQPFPEDTILGKVQIVIPKLGAIVAAIRTPLGIGVLLALFAVLWVMPLPTTRKEQVEHENG